MKNKKTKWMVKVAMLSAAAVILMLFEFPLPFIAPPFYKLDFSEVPVLIGAFALGPLAGVAIEGIKVLLNLLINGTITAGVGEAANFLVGISFVLPAELIYRRRKTKKTAVLGMVIGGMTMVFLSYLVNLYILIPAYGNAMGISADAFIAMGSAVNSSVDNLWKLVLICVVPFNAIKVIAVSVITTIVYKHISHLLKD